MLRMNSATKHLAFLERTRPFAEFTLPSRTPFGPPVQRHERGAERMCSG
jgi:hypothetical protein